MKNTVHAVPKDT